MRTRAQRMMKLDLLRYRLFDRLDAACAKLDTDAFTARELLDRAKRLELSIRARTPRLP